MTDCPHCQIDIAGKLPRDTFNLDPYRNCPLCGGAFTVDAATRRRQIIAVFIALVSLAATLGLAIKGSGWLPLALLTYAVLALWMYWGNKQVEFVIYEPQHDADHAH